MRLLGYCILIAGMVPSVVANPVAMETPYTMIGEHVLVGIARGGAVVTGRYRFHVTSDASERWGDPPYPIRLRLPVPVAKSLPRNEVAAEIRPIVTVKDTRYQPEGDVEFWHFPGLPENVRTAGFSYWIDRRDLGEEFEVEIQYDQPVITVGGRDVVFYVPYLPSFELYSKRMRLRRESYVIDCEGVESTYIRLISPVAGVLRSEPHLVSVLARNLEVVAIERMPTE